MAKLISEDSEFRTTLEIVRGKERVINGQKWERFKIILTSGTYKLVLGEGQAADDAARHTEEDEKDACLLCRTPKDELADLANKLYDLANFDRDKVMFEPFEPSFDLVIQRSGVTGLKVQIWLDSGNAKTGIYRWDGVGCRFFTLTEHLLDFVRELKAEFAC